MLKSNRKNLNFYMAENASPSFKIASKLHKTYIPYNSPINFDYVIIDYYEKFSNDINAQNITYKALETTNNLIVYIIKDLYINHDSEYYKKLLLFTNNLISNFKLNNLLQYTYGNQIILQFFKPNN